MYPRAITAREVVGWVTSGGYGHHVGKSLAPGYVPTELVEQATGWEIEIIGVTHTATLLSAPPFDPNGERLLA